MLLLEKGTIRRLTRDELAELDASKDQGRKS